MYFHDLTQVLRLLAQNTVAGASVVFVVGDSAPYGVYVDTPKLITSLASELGFDVKPPVFLRRRGLRWISNGTRHRVPLSEVAISLVSPGA